LFIESFNRIYVYGSRGVEVFNPDSMEAETVIPLTTFGNYHKVWGLLASSGNRMAFDGDHYLYCFTDELHLVVINLQTNSVSDNVDISATYSEDPKIDNTVLKYDLDRNLIYLTVSLSPTSSICYRFNANNISDYYSIGYENTKIYDIEINKINLRLFVTYSQRVNNVTNYYFQVFNINFVPITGISGFESTTKLQEIEYIYEPQNNIHKAICFPASGQVNNHRAFVFDGNTFEKSTIDLMIRQRNVTSTEYVTSEQIIYFSYSDAAYDGIGKLNITDLQIEDIPFSGSSDYTSDILVSSSKIFLGKRDKVIVVDKDPPHNLFSHDYYDDLTLSLAASANKIFAVNYENCSLEIFDLSGNLIDSKILGGPYLSGAYNSAFNKVFMYNPTIGDHFQRIQIKNLITLENDFIDFTEFGYGYVSGVVSDDSRGYVYVSIASDPFDSEGEIKIIDAQTNTLLPNGYLLPDNTVCRNIYMANDKLYCVLEKYYMDRSFVYSRVFIIDLTNPANTYLLSPLQTSLQGQLYASFDQDDQGNVFIALNDKGNSLNGKLILIDHVTNTISLTFNVLDPYQIAFDEISKKVFYTKYSFSSDLGIVDIELHQASWLDLSDHFLYLLKPFYDIFRNEICIFGHVDSPYTYDNCDTRLAWIKPVSLDITEIVTTDPMAISLAYNTLNGDIYTFYPKVISNGIMQYLGIIPRTSFTNDLYALENEHRSLIDNYEFMPTELFFDQNNNYLFIPNHYFSDFYKIDLPQDQLTLQPGIWNWISFPRLDRVGNNPVLAQNVLLNIDPFPTYLQMTNLPPHTPILGEQNIVYDGINWSGDLTQIQSTLGYKLETDNTTISYLPMEGTQLDPAFPMTIYTGYQNWVGYYPTWSQDPFDALADVLDELTLIKHHDWVCYKHSGVIMQPGEPQPTYWICSKTKPLKYADMLILECSEDVTFQWGGASSGGNHELPKSDYYSYTEKPDYTPIFIELDTGDHPLEIGAFIADSCIGATVVEELDSMAMIRGYMPNDSSGMITFEKYYGNEKSASDRIDEYYVLNNRTNLQEKGLSMLAKIKNITRSLLKRKPIQVPGPIH